MREYASTDRLPAGVPAAPARRPARRAVRALRHAAPAPGTTASVPDEALDVGPARTSAGPACRSSPGGCGRPAAPPSASRSVARSHRPRRPRPGGRWAGSPISAGAPGCGSCSDRRPPTPRCRRTSSRRWSPCSPRWDWEQRPIGVVAVGSRTRPRLVGSLARRLAQVGRLEWLGELHPRRRRSARRRRAPATACSGWPRCTTPSRSGAELAAAAGRARPARCCSSTTSSTRAGR